MSNSKTKEIIICIVTIAILMLTIVTDVFATEGETDWNAFLSDVNNVSGVNSINNVVNNTTNNVVNNTANNVVSNNNVNNTNNTNNVTTMPNTGVDYSVVFIIAICVISSIYAYKKIKDYNNV